MVALGEENKDPVEDTPGYNLERVVQSLMKEIEFVRMELNLLKQRVLILEGDD